jgi:hypothetical protein
VFEIPMKLARVALPHTIQQQLFYADQALERTMVSKTNSGEQ